MTSLFVKSVLVLLVVGPCVCSVALRGFSESSSVFSHTKETVVSAKGVFQPRTYSESAPEVWNEGHYPAENQLHRPTVYKSNLEENERFNNINEDPAMKMGEYLATKYFGPGAKKGFRWGTKLNKRYRAVADKCENFEQSLTSCNPIQKNHDPRCVLHCIVEITENITDHKPISCTEYEECDYPVEATCSLDQPDNYCANA